MTGWRGMPDDCNKIGTSTVPGHAILQLAGNNRAVMTGNTDGQ